MTIHFEQLPYYDDFTPSKQFHKILFKPEYSVQARELTQSQSIIQDQISLFGNHIFKNYSPVSGGSVTTNFKVRYLKVDFIGSDGTDVNVYTLLGKTISNKDKTFY